MLLFSSLVPLFVLILSLNYEGFDIIGLAPTGYLAQCLAHSKEILSVIFHMLLIINKYEE